MVVPGLLQTRAYASAIIRGGEPSLPDDEVEQRIELRMARQEILSRKSTPPTVWCVLDESVLYRRAKDPAVLAEQLERLIKLGELPNVHIQVLPFDAFGLHAGISGTFTLLTFGPELVGDPGVAHAETRIRSFYYEDAAHIMRYRDTWSRVQVQALSPEDSLAVLACRIKEVIA